MVHQRTAALRCAHGPTTPSNMAADALATCHSACHASHAAASPVCEYGGGARVGGVRVTWGHHHYALGLARPTTADSAPRLVVFPV